jgi:hypothetical protein
MSYKMPQCYRGQIVRWYDGGVKDDSRACPAIVLVENHSSLHLKVWGLDGDFQKECVKHVSDPNAKEIERVDNGGWDYTEKDMPILQPAPVKQMSK